MLIVNALDLSQIVVQRNYRPHQKKLYYEWDRGAKKEPMDLITCVSCAMLMVG